VTKDLRQQSHFGCNFGLESLYPRNGQNGTEIMPIVWTSGRLVDWLIPTKAMAHTVSKGSECK
jgi:hypothetical protein